MKVLITLAAMGSLVLATDTEANGCLPDGYACEWVTQCCTLGDLTCCKSGRCHGGNDCVGNGDENAFDLYLAGFTSMGKHEDFSICAPPGVQCGSTNDCCYIIGGASCCWDDDKGTNVCKPSDDCCWDDKSTPF